MVCLKCRKLRPWSHTRYFVAIFSELLAPFFPEEMQLLYRQRPCAPPPPRHVWLLICETPRMATRQRPSLTTACTARLAMGIPNWLLARHFSLVQPTHSKS